jgi:hypothetical protein
MRTRPRRVISLRWRASTGAVALVTAAALAVTTSGCLSNEYRIQKDELRRLAAVAPEARGQSVRVSQTLGDRRSDAIDPAIPAAPDVELRETELDVDQGELDVNLNGSVGGDGGGRPVPNGVHAGGGWRAAPPAPAPHGAPSVGFHGAPAGGGGGFHGTPSGGGWHGGGGGYHVPTPSGGGGGGGINLGGGGGKDIGGVLVVIAIVAIVAATAATISLAASEGVKFEGHAEMAPEQLVYLSKGGHAAGAVRLGDLTPEEAEAADGALVMDDEGYGLRRLDHAPLDRKGGVFRFDLGAGAFTIGDARASGVSSHIQGGYFFTRTFGLVLDLGLAGGALDPCCTGALAPGGTLTRHSIGLEAEALPLGLGPLHLGVFGGGGVAIAGAGGSYETGPMASGGALLELDLTSHMALALRGGASWAWMPDGASSAGTVTGGLSIY